MVLSAVAAAAPPPPDGEYTKTTQQIIKLSEKKNTLEVNISLRAAGVKACGLTSSLVWRNWRIDLCLSFMTWLLLSVLLAFLFLVQAMGDSHANMICKNAESQRFTMLSSKQNQWDIVSSSLIVLTCQLCHKHAVVNVLTS